MNHAIFFQMRVLFMQMWKTLCTGDRQAMVLLAGRCLIDIVLAPDAVAAAFPDVKVGCPESPTCNHSHEIMFPSVLTSK